MNLVKHCPACGKRSMVSVPEAGYIAWQQGTLYAREAFPDLTRAQIDTVLTGWHEECVEKLEVNPDLMDSPEFDLDLYIEG